MPRPRRRLRVAAVAAGAVVLTVALLAAVGWYGVVPRWRPPLQRGEAYGIDVSVHQGEVDWPKVAADDVRFAYLKATEGGDLVDRTFERSWTDARRAGLRVGAYHFFTLCRPAADQAANFLRVAPPLAGALPPAVDLEIGGNCRGRPSRDHVASELDRFLSEVEAAWRTRVLIYTDDRFEHLYPVRERLGRDLWTRRFLLRPSQRWTVWQLHGLARVDGVGGPVDLNVGRLTRLEALTAGSAG